MILPADMAIIFLMKSFSVFYNMYRFSDIDTYCWAYAGWLESNIGSVVFLCTLSGVDAWIVRISI